MKYFLFIIFLMIAPVLTSQESIFLDDGGICMDNLEFSYNGLVNEKNSYIRFRLSLYWTGSEWVIESPQGLIYSNSTDTTLNPPCFGNGEWELSPDFASLCGPLMNVSGECDIPPVPTLSQWSLIILGFLILIFGITAIRNTELARIE